MTAHTKKPSLLRRRLFGLVCSLAVLGSAATTAGAAPFVGMLSEDTGTAETTEEIADSKAAQPSAASAPSDVEIAEEPAVPADTAIEDAPAAQAASAADGAEPAADEPAQPAADYVSSDTAEAAEQDSADAADPAVDSATDPATEPATVSALAATDPTGDLEIALTTVTGTEPFDAEPGPGKDTSPDDEIIRTNDLVKYYVDVTSAKGGQGTITFKIPKGQEVRRVDGWCKSPDGSGAISKPTPELAPPAVPLTKTSWQELEAQTLVCQVTFDQNVSERYFVSAYQRSEVPNETVLEKPSVTVDMGDGRVASDDTEIAQVVSAGPRWDVSKNHINNEENTGFVNRVARACPWDETKSCWLVDHSLLISAESSGKGATPLTGDVTLVDNLDPRKFYQIDGLDPAFWDDPANVEKYAPRLAKCADKDHLYSMPNPRVGEGYEPRDTENSVRESGVAMCEHTPGEDMTITLSDTDWSLYTYPTKIPSTNREIPQPGRAYAVSVIVKIAIPLDAVKDLGYSASDTSTAKNLDYKNVYTDFHATDLNGDVQDASVDEAWNNYRTDTVWVRPPKVSANKYWAGITDDPLNTPASQYTKGDPTKQGPPGSTVQYGGDIPASAGQVILSSVTLNGSNLSNPQKVTGLLCDSWDNSKLHLQAGDYPGGKSYGAHMFPSEGKAVWAGGRLDFPKGHASDYVVEYSGDAHVGGDMPGESESMCRTGTWYSDPADVPGNDPALISQGRYTGVNAVRIYAKLPEPANNATWLIREHYNIALRVVEGQAEKTIIPNWLGYTTGWGSEYYTKDDLLSGGEGLYEVPTNYHPENHRGDAGLGDRLHYAPAYVRIGKEVRPVGEDSFTRIASATAGDEIEWRIKTTLHSAAPKGGTPQPVTIEDCLPPDFSYVDASVAPSLVQPAPAPADAELTCDEGTYIRWILEDRVANEPIDPIIMRTRISAFAVSETYRNVSSVQTLPLDPSPLEARTSDAFVDVAAVQGVRIEKTALTPITQVNIAGREHLQQNVWEVALYNQDFKDVVRNVDVIDALPVANGINGSDFEGTMTFVSAELTDGKNVQILYTSAPTVLTDPTGGATVLRRNINEKEMLPKCRLSRRA